METQLLFCLGSFTLALPLRAVVAVERLGRVTAVPFAAPWLRGVTAVRGAVVSVVDLGRFAGLAATGATPGARLLIVQAAGKTTALLVDRVSGLVPAPARFEPAPAASGPLAEWWDGTFSRDGEIIPVVDPQRLLGSPAFDAFQM